MNHAVRKVILSVIAVLLCSLIVLWTRDYADRRQCVCSILTTEEQTYAIDDRLYTHDIYWRYSMIYLTGDTHGDFQRIAHFCARMHTKPSDIMIILGDAGINFYGGWRDLHKKEFISKLPITLFCIHGNHEKRPATITSYSEQEWHGGIVYVEEQFPSILFAKDGEVYDLNGMRAIAIGGAYSIDWMLRIPGRSWWPDEQPSQEIQTCVESKLEHLGWKVDVVLSHTVPLKYEPVEVFLPGIDQRKVDKSTELWLDSIENRLQYGKWYAGHYHVAKSVDRIQIMFEDYDVLANL